MTGLRSKTQQIDELLEEWKRRLGEQANRLCPDGIIDDEAFAESEPRILFVAKEPNHPDPKADGFSYREWWTTELSHGFTYRLCEWAYGILNDFPPLTELDEDKDNSLKKKCIKSIAFINVKKVGGGGTANAEEIRATVERDRDLLRKQIEIIDPTVIVGGIGASDLWDVLFPGLSLIDSGFDIKIARYKTWNIIDFYHPSYPVPRAMSYALLGRVVKSQAFANLVES